VQLAEDLAQADAVLAGKNQLGLHPFFSVLIPLWNTK
jgi:hypothetical protein